MNLGSLLARAIADGRVRDGGGALEMTAVEARIKALSAAGVGARESVGVSCENGRPCIETYVALARIGAVAVCLPPNTAADQRRVLMSAMGCRVMATDGGIEILERCAPFRSWPEDIHWILHSSGSTGSPKPIALTWSAVVKNARDTVRILGITSGAIHLGSMSQCYANGLFNSFLLPLATEGTAHLGPVATVANFGAYMRALRESSASILWVNPTVVSVLSRRAEELQSVKMLVSCTAPLTRKACIAAEAGLKRPVLQSYGLAETLIVSVEEPARSAVSDFSAGLPVAGVDSVFTGSRGTLEIVNGAVTPGYIRIENGVAEFSLPDGTPGERFVSADRGEIAINGTLHVLGRLTGVINVGGVKIGAEQMEEVLRTFPGIRNAVVVGIPVGEGVERPAALIESDEALDLESVAMHCVSAVGRHGRPVLLRTVSRLPLTANGKVDRRAVEERLLSPAQ
jgi:acyl-coenzyme A synthetase/AMP-(fatty) acid ligase